MPAEEHPVFQSPGSDSVPLWRYMDFTKYVWMLEHRALYFSRVDRFDDPLEGSLSAANLRLRPEIYGDQIPAHVFQQMGAFSRWSRQWTFLNCWHMNEYESAAMWRLYAKTNEAIAVQSTFGRLRQSLPPRTYLGIVHYVDYDNYFIPEGNTMSAYVHKRRSFEHEQEVRALISDLPTEEGKIMTGKTNPETGRVVPMVLEEFIERVFVAPTSPDWYYDLVTKVTKKYNLTLPVLRSELDRAPVY